MDITALSVYLNRGCNILVGDLHISGIRTSDVRGLIEEALRTVTTIRGSLVISDIDDTAQITMFRGLQRLDGISLMNLPSVVDARMPSLLSIDGPVEVIGCHRLCPARYPSTGSASDLNCPGRRLEFYFHISGPGAIDSALLSQMLCRELWSFGASYGIANETCSHSIIESGTDWENVAVSTFFFSPEIYFGLHLRNLLSGRPFSVLAVTPEEIAIFESHNLTVLAPARGYAAPSGYNSGNYLLSAKSRSDGVRLRWDRFLKPVELNFIQFRLIQNLTLTLVGNDTSPFDTLPCSFDSSSGLDFLVPLSLLAAGQHYEFRMGFPYVGFTYYSNSQFVKAFSAGSGYVGQVQWTSTNETIRVWWEAPEDTEGLIGYNVVLYLPAAINSTSLRRESEKGSDSSKRVIASFVLTLTSRSISVRCLAGVCLIPDKIYSVDIAVIRETGAALSLTIDVRTKETVPFVPPQILIFTVEPTNVLICVGDLNRLGARIVRLEAQLTVLSSNNEVVDAVNLTISQNVSSLLPLESCLAMSVSDLKPSTEYALRVRGHTQISGASPWTPAIVFVTPKIVYSMQAPSVRHLTPAELERFKWEDGFLVSWYPPEDLDVSTMHHFDVADGEDFLVIAMTTDLFLFVESLDGPVCVRVVTAGGIGSFSPVAALPRPSSSSSTPYFAIFFALIVFIGAVIFGVVFVWRYRIHKRRMAQVIDMQRRIAPNIIEMLKTFNKGEFKVPRNVAPLHVRFLASLGEGRFGTVMKGVLDEYELTGVPGYTVAVKMPKDEESFIQVEELKLEAAIMAQFRHPNVVSLIGQVNEQGIFVLIAQYCEYGSLLSWLKGNGAEASTGTLTTMALDVATGMEYLSSIGIVHRDLAARNVLVSSDYSCKISDFGFARHTSEGTIETSENMRVPVRWVAPEVFETKVYTTKSDVWSFGILLTELYDHGAVPYGDWNPHRIVRKVRRGYRLPRPTGCPAEIYDLMVGCWSLQSTERPSFAMLCVALGSMNGSMIDFEEQFPRNRTLERFAEIKSEAGALKQRRSHLDLEEVVSHDLSSRGANSMERNISLREGEGTLCLGGPVIDEVDEHLDIEIRAGSKWIFVVESDRCRSRWPCLCNSSQPRSAFKPFGRQS